MKPLCIDLFAGLGGWSKGFLAEGWGCIGFDVERHRYPAREVRDSHVKAAGISWSRGDSFNGTNEKRLRDTPLTGGWDEYPAQLVLQDVLTLHGSQFRHADCIVASPPCQEFSYMAMPWKRGKQIVKALRGAYDKTGKVEFPDGYTGSCTVSDLTALFDACFRIQREACEAAGRHIPMVVENVKGAQPWVGRANANYGSFYLWGDVRSVGGRIVAAHQVRFGAPAVKAYRSQKHNPDGTQHGTGSWFAIADSKNRGASVKVPSAQGRRTDVGNGTRFTSRDCGIEGGTKNNSGSWFAVAHNTESGHSRNPVNETSGVKRMSGQHGLSRPDGKGGRDLGGPNDPRRFNSRSDSRKAASAMIAEIPFELSSHIARCYYPRKQEATA